MGYYPTNFYSNFPYGQQYQPQYFNGPTLSSQQQIMQQQNQMAQSNMLQGKVVDGEDIVKVTDVPIGGYGVFPKADFSEVYIKSWNNNGTTTITTYKPIIEETPKEDVNSILLEKINKIEEKIDSIVSPPNNTNTNTVKRKEF